MIYANSRHRYDGQYKDAKKHGSGKWLYASGKCFEGESIDGKLVQGQFLVPTLASRVFHALFSGGDEVIDGYEVYSVTLRESDESGEIVKVCKFSNGELIEE
jgi:hypothetical protein